MWVTFWVVFLIGYELSEVGSQGKTSCEPPKKLDTCGVLKWCNNDIYMQYEIIRGLWVFSLSPKIGEVHWDICCANFVLSTIKLIQIFVFWCFGICFKYFFTSNLSHQASILVQILITKLHIFLSTNQKFLCTSKYNLTQIVNRI